MKTLIKITALTAVAAFALLSCGPEAAVSGVDWDELYNKYDPRENTSPEAHSPLTGATEATLHTTATTANNGQVKLAFNSKADVLKKDDVQEIMEELHNFLTFHQYTALTATDYGKADELGPPLDYEYIRREGDTIIVKLTKTFTDTDTPVIIKVRGDEYTFMDGKKMDRDRNGEPGEAVYDDWYSTSFAITGSNAPAQTPFLQPGNKDWFVTLNAIDASPTISGDQPSKIFPSLLVASISLPTAISLPTDRTNSDDLYSAVAEVVKNGLKIQKYTSGEFNPDTLRDDEGTWTDISADISYDSVNRDFKATSVTMENMVPLRIVWAGEAPVITGAEYFGVKQWIKIYGNNVIDASMYPLAYQVNTVYSAATTWINTTDANSGSSTYDPNKMYLYNNVGLLKDVESKDSLNQNVVIVLKGVYADIGGTFVWLKDYNNESDKKIFMDNFKIAYYSNQDGPVPSYGVANAANFKNRPDVVFIPIVDIEIYDDPNTLSTPGLDSIRITLDPKYKIPKGTPPVKYFYISDKIGLNNNKTTYGDIHSWQFGFFQAIEAGTFF